MLLFAAPQNTESRKQACARTRCLTNAPIFSFCHVRHVQLYLEKKIPQPPPERCYINRIGIEWLFWLLKRHGPPQKGCHTGSSKTGYRHLLGLRGYLENTARFGEGSVICLNLREARRIPQERRRRPWGVSHRGSNGYHCSAPVRITSGLGDCVPPHPCVQRVALPQNTINHFD